MTQDDALKLFDTLDTDVIRVRDVRTGIVYYLYRDIVEAVVNNYVYGYFFQSSQRRNQIHRWFYLCSVEHFTYIGDQLQ